MRLDDQKEYDQRPECHEFDMRNCRRAERQAECRRGSVQENRQQRDESANFAESLAALEAALR